jgi:hypothetical protein
MVVRKNITKLRVFFSSMKWFGMELRAFFTYAEWLGTKFRAFSVPRNRRMNQYFHLFRVPERATILGYTVGHLKLPPAPRITLSHHTA